MGCYLSGHQESFRGKVILGICAHCNSTNACPLPVLQTNLHICKACLTAVALEVETLTFRTVLILLLFVNSVFLACSPALRNHL